MDKLKHTGLGIASFIIVSISIIIILTIIVIGGMMEASTPGILEDETSMEAMILGLFGIISFFGLLVAFGLGIAGLFQKDRNKIFAILGIIFSIVIIIFIIFIMNVIFLRS